MTVPCRILAGAALIVGCAAAGTGTGRAWAQGPVERVFELAIRAGALAPDKRVLRVLQNDAVRLRWTADARTIVHLHGYDIETEIVPGRSVEMPFRAHASGRFPVSVHGDRGDGSHHGRPLTILEVHPR